MYFKMVQFSGYQFLKMYFIFVYVMCTAGYRTEIE